MSQSVRFIRPGLYACVLVLPITASIAYILFNQQKVVRAKKSKAKGADVIRHSKCNEVGGLI